MRQLGKSGIMVWSIVAVVVLLAAACGPSAEPTATTAPAQPTATTAPAQPTATTAPAQPTATTAPGQPTATTAPAEVKLRPVPVVALPAPNPEARHGGLFRQLNPGTESANFNPWESVGGGTFLKVYETLLINNVFERGKGEEILPNLAYDWWIDASGEAWTFKLQDGLQFHDGEDFTCADAKFSLDTIRLGHDETGDTLGAVPKAPVLARVTETLCPDDHTLVIKTDGPMPFLAAALTVSNFSVLPEHVFKGNLELAQTQMGPGLGPFLFDEYVVTEFMKHKRNPDYWDQPYPYLDEVHEVFMGSRTAEIAAYRVGRGELISHFGLTSGIRDEMEAAGRLVVEPPIFNHGLAFVMANWQREPWGDPRFSLALRCAIDSAKVNELAANGEGKGYEGPVFPLATDPGGTKWGLTKEEWMAMGPCHGPSAETDMEQRRQIARDLLAEMGFGPDNLARPHFITRTQDEREWVVVLDDLAKVGIEPEVEIIDSASLSVKQFEGDFDIMLKRMRASMLDPDFWLSELFLSTSDRNYGKYINAELDALIGQQGRTLDAEKRQEIIKEISRLILRENPTIRYNFRVAISEYPPWVKDLYRVEAFNLTTFQQFRRVWIDREILDRLGG